MPTIDLNGRRGIGISQPKAGTDFPLVAPSYDIEYLLADLHVAFDQPSDYTDVPAFVPPYNIHWLSGFGDLAAEFPTPTQNMDETWNSVCQSESVGSASASVQVIECLPIPRHDHDIIITDSAGRFVFDSTGADITYTTRTWGDRLRVVTWQHPTGQYVSLVYHTAWNADDDPPYREYSTYFFPSQAVLDERTVVQLPKRLRSLTVVLDNLRETGVEFAAGYNMELQTSDTTDTAGDRHSTRVVFDAAPGGGLGVFPDCDPGALQITTINGVEPTTAGDFFLSASDCYWIRQPMRITDGGAYSATPEILLTPGSILTADMPDPLAGLSKAADGWPLDDDPRYAHLQFGNDCQPCCDCPDYVAVARYMNAVRDVYQEIGTKIENTRDTYHTNRERWLAAAACVNRRPLRLRVLPQACPFLDVAAQFCNHGTECLRNVALQITLSTLPVGATATEVPGYTYITGATTRPGSSIPATSRYDMAGTWPTFTAFFDTVQPGQSVSARFRLGFDNCGVVGTVPYDVTGTLTAKINGAVMTVESADAVNVQVPAEAVDNQTLNCPDTTTPSTYAACN